MNECLILPLKGGHNVARIPSHTPSDTNYRKWAASESDTLEHKFGEIDIIGYFKNAIAQGFIGSKPFCFCSAFPVGEIMLKTAVTPVVAQLMIDASGNMEQPSLAKGLSLLDPPQPRSDR